MSSQGICLLAFGFTCILLAFHTTECHVSDEVEKRLSTLEKQGQEQALQLIKQGQEIQYLNAELKFYKEQVNKYKQQNDDQETTIGEQTAKLQDYKNLAIQNQNDLADYKTQLTKQETTIGEQTAKLQDYKDFAIQNQNDLAHYKTQLTKQETTIGEQTAKIQEYKELAIENQNELAHYKTQLTKQERRVKALEKALIVDKPTEGKPTEGKPTDVNQLSQSDVYTNAWTGMENGQMNLTDNASRDSDDVNDPSINSHKRLVLGNIESPVAFHATTDKKEIAHIGINQRIALDLVLLNLGNGYHNQHGLFIAPVGGIYSFSASVLSSTAAHPEVQVNIVKNGQRLGAAYAHGDNGKFDQGAVTVVTQLAKDDEVWVAEIYITDTSYRGLRFTAFSGFLISQI